MSFFKIIGIGILVLIIFALLMRGMAVHDAQNALNAEIAKIKAKGDPVTAADLAGEPILDAENGAVVYEEIFAQIDTIDKSAQGINPSIYSDIYSPEKNFGDAQAWKEARKIVQLYEPALSRVDEAISRPKCRFQTNWEDGFNALFPFLARARQLSPVLAVRAVVDSKDGKTDKAINSIKQAFMLSKSVEDGHSFIHQLARIGLIRIASSGLRGVAHYSDISERQARELYDVLSSINLDNALSTGFKGERAIFLITLKEYDVFECSRYFEDGRLQHASKCLEYVRKPYSIGDEVVYLRELQKAIDTSDQPFRKTPPHDDHYYNSLPWYAEFTRTLLPVYGKATAKRDEAIAEIYGSQIFLGLLGYKDRFGTYPKTLEELKSKLGWKLREDPFSGNKFIYSRQGKGFLLYSIGANLRDDGGQKNDYTSPQNKKDDIAWRMER